VVIDGDLRGLFCARKTCHYFEVYFSEIHFGQMGSLTFAITGITGNAGGEYGAYLTGCEKALCGPWYGVVNSTPGARRVMVRTVEVDWVGGWVA
jgi:hypothetical protein